MFFFKALKKEQVIGVDGINMIGLWKLWKDCYLSYFWLKISVKLNCVPFSSGQMWLLHLQKFPVSKRFSINCVEFPC